MHASAVMFFKLLKLKGNIKDGEGRSGSPTAENHFNCCSAVAVSTLGTKSQAKKIPAIGRCGDDL
jgi:hypothetical protein